MQRARTPQTGNRGHPWVTEVVCQAERFCEGCAGTVPISLLEQGLAPCPRGGRQDGRSPAFIGLATARFHELVDLVPALGFVLGEVPDVPELDAQASRYFV